MILVLYRVREAIPKFVKVIETSLHSIIIIPTAAFIFEIETPLREPLKTNFSYVIELVPWKLPVPEEVGGKFLR